ncbi:MAG: DNA polymerase III subunit alpha [Bryobacterales bacterium]|nr:DNA polymerase III subunit alpha [Bryobacterales bacterium]
MLDGAADIPTLIDTASRMEMPAIAMSDHGNLFGAVEFYNTAKAKGVNPIIGCEVYVTPGRMSDRKEGDGYNHLLLLAETQEGYKNLVKLVSTAYTEGFYYKPRIDKDLLAQHAKGIICSSACLKGDINEAVVRGNYDVARRLAHEYQDLFGKGNFFLELQDHGLQDDPIVMRDIVRLASDTGMPLIATNDSHYIAKADSRLQEVLLCISTGTVLSDPNRMKFDSQEFYLKSKEEMLRLFGEVPDALDHTWEIAQRCQVKLEKVANPFPDFTVPQGHSLETYFEYVTRQGFEQRCAVLRQQAAEGRLKHPLAAYEERLEREIKLIESMKFTGYFLIVWDFIRYARLRGIPVGPGRGSAAGSLVSYCLRITDIDPLQYNLLFERFLNPERISFPDVDVDFCTRRRGEVIQYVTEKYGREQVAQIITFNTLGAKAAIKDVGRVLNMGFGDVDRITKMIPPVLNIKLKEAIATEPKLREAAEQDPRVKEVLDLAQRLEGKARNAGVHAAGVVISPIPLKEIVPLYKTNKDEIVTQYDMGGLEKLSLLKMDFLGLTTLTIIEDALGLIAKTRGIQIQPEEIPLDDPKAYQIFSRALTSGVFQFESAGMRDVLRRYEPTRIEDLIALNALYRPGPIQGGMIDDFIGRKHGRKKVTYELPQLEEILAETYGVIVYQEQVMQIANVLAGYSLGEADILRRAMGKKNADEMEQQRIRFLKGAAERDVPEKKAEKIFDLMAQFAGYGFNKSHSAAYAYLAYITGYLKAHYPVEFMAALLTSETGNTAKVVKYIQECREMKIDVLPPDVNASDWNFTPDGEAIRFGLGAVKNVGQGAVEAIAAARANVGRFTTLYQFCEEIDPAAINRRVLESLIKTGAMDELEGTRAQKFHAVESALEAASKVWRDRSRGQTGLFGFEDGNDEASAAPLPRVPDWTPRQAVGYEKELLGFYVTGHPLDEYRELVLELRSHESDGLEDLPRNFEVKLCGVFGSIQRRRNKEGKAWASMVLEDWLGTVDMVCFAKNFEMLADQIKEDEAVLVSGLVFPEDNAPPKISVQDILPLRNAHVRYPAMVSIRVPLQGEGAPSPTRVEHLHTLFTKKPGDTEVQLVLEKQRDFIVTMLVETKVRPDREFLAELAKVCGEDAYQVISSGS